MIFHFSPIQSLDLSCSDNAKDSFADRFVLNILKLLQSIKTSQKVFILPPSTRIRAIQ